MMPLTCDAGGGLPGDDLRHVCGAVRQVQVAQVSVLGAGPDSVRSSLMPAVFVCLSPQHRPLSTCLTLARIVCPPLLLCGRAVSRLLKVQAYAARSRYAADLHYGTLP